MIFVCEYDGSADERKLQEYAFHLPLPPQDTACTEIRRKKRRERILAWMLLEYALERTYPVGTKVWHQKRQGAAESGSRVLKADFPWLVEQLDIQRTEHGKPCSSAHPEIRFNLSHCERACACVLGAVDGGIDVERKFAYRGNLARKVCHPAEAAVLYGLSQEAQERQLRFLWSMKESFVKLDGRGLGYGMDRIDLSQLLPITPAGFYEKEGGPAFRVAEQAEYTFAACSTKKEMLEEMEIISERELVKFMYHLTEDLKKQKSAEIGSS